MRIPQNEKAVPTLTLYESDVHMICLYDLKEAKIILAGAIAAYEETTIISVMGIDCLVTHDYVLLPLDVEIVKNIIRTYLGVVGLRSHNYYKENTLKDALEE